MNNQVKLIDQTKLLEWIDDELAKQYPESVAQYVDGRETVLEILKHRIEQGIFNPDTSTVPTIKPGDKVKHKRRGVGIVVDSYGSKTVADFDDGLFEVLNRELEVVE